MSKYTIVFLTILLCMFGIYNFTTDIGVSSNIKNTQYANYLTTATHDAAKEMASQTTGAVALPDQSDRTRVVNTFYRSLMMDFNYMSEEDEQKLHAYVPVVAMIDTNGYYICYNENYRENINGANVVTMRSVITTINTWTTKIVDKNNACTYLVRYYLGHDVDVTKMASGAKEQKTYSGNYGDVYKELGKPKVLERIGFDSGTPANRSASDPDALFERYQRSVIIPDIQEKIEYYINNHNKVATSYATNYTFEMPQTSEDDWVRLIQNPTVIAFLQGIRVSNTQDYLNIYSLGGGEIRKQNYTTYSTDSKGNTSYSEGSKSGAQGYVPGDNSAAKNGGTAQDNISSDQTVSHIHVGNPNAGKANGCYTTPVYHSHNSSCYKVVNHVHYNRLGIAVPDSYTLDTTRIGEEPYYAKDASGNTLYYDDGTDSEKPITTCYTIPVYHVHTEDCYEINYHHHTGNPTTGGGCYGEAVYHKHTAACYSNSSVSSYTMTSNVYHKHVFPTIHYGRQSDPAFDTTDIGEISQYTDFVILYADTTDSCYKAKYQSVELNWNVKRINLLTGVSENITMVTYNNAEATRTYDAVKKKGDQRIWFDEDYEYIGTLAKDVPAAVESNTWDSTVDALGNRKWKFVEVETDAICGMTEKTIVGTEPMLDENGDPITVTTTTPGTLICGKTTDTVEYYKINCGHTDLWNMTDEDRELYRADAKAYVWNGTAVETIKDENGNTSSNTIEVTGYQTSSANGATNIGDAAKFTVYYDSEGQIVRANDNWTAKYDYTVTLASIASFRNEINANSVEGKTLVCGYDTQKKLDTPIGYKRSCESKTGALDHTYLACGKLDEDEINSKLSEFSSQAEKNEFLNSDIIKNSIEKYAVGCGRYEGEQIAKSVQEELEKTAK